MDFVSVVSRQALRIGNSYRTAAVLDTRAEEQPSMMVVRRNWAQEEQSTVLLPTLRLEARMLQRLA